MKKRKVSGIIEYNKMTSEGDVFMPGCFTLAPGIKILESHKGPDGITIITEAEITQISIISNPVSHANK